MTNQQILQSDFLDILFENRNKLYGAYHLRRVYDSHLLKAIGGTALIVLPLLFIGNTSSEKIVPERKVEVVLIACPIFPIEKPELPQQKNIEPPAKRLVRQEVFMDRMKLLDNIIDPPATQKRLENVGVGSIRTDGLASIGVPDPPQAPHNGGIGTSEPVVEKKEALLPSRQPQFPGGVGAWLIYLREHMQPPRDMEPGEKRTSQIRFSVDETGVITNFQIVQSGGTEFDNEVIRVLKKMPKWLPALQNGKPIAVSFTQPVTFVAQDE